MVSYHIRYLANTTQNKLQLLRILILFTECDYVEKVKRYDSFILLDLNFLKSLKINLGSKGLKDSKRVSHVENVLSVIYYIQYTTSLNNEKFSVYGFPNLP